MAKDYDVKQDLTMDEIQAYYKQQRELERELDSMNLIKISGKVVSTSAPDVKQKMGLNKDTNKYNIPLFDDNGKPIMKSQQYFLSLAFEGGTMDIEISKDWFTSIAIGSRVLLEGSKIVDRYGNLKDNFYRYTILF